MTDKTEATANICSYHPSIISKATEITKPPHNFNHEDVYRLSKACLHLLFPMPPTHVYPQLQNLPPHPSPQDFSPILPPGPEEGHSHHGQRISSFPIHTAAGNSFLIHRITKTSLPPLLTTCPLNFLLPLLLQSHACHLLDSSLLFCSTNWHHQIQFSTYWLPYIRLPKYPPITQSS
jgi:hypothetical protein